MAIKLSPDDLLRLDKSRRAAGEAVDMAERASRCGIDCDAELAKARFLLETLDAIEREFVPPGTRR